MKKTTCIYLLIACCTAVFACLFSYRVSGRLLYADHSQSNQQLCFEVQSSYEHNNLCNTVNTGVTSTVKLSSRNDTRNILKLIKDKSFSTENLPTKQFVRLHFIQIVSSYIPQNLGLNVLHRLNI